MSLPPTETAAFIWKCLERGDTVSGVVENVCAEFDVDAATADRQLHRLLEKLKERRLITWQEGGHEARRG